MSKGVISCYRRQRKKEINVAMSNHGTIPQILDRDSIIIMSESIECECGRTKEKAHCPKCGRTKLYAMSDREPAQMASGDVVKSCIRYRCIGCGHKFNDVEWYFNCTAPKKIDWAATKAQQKEAEIKEATRIWMLRIEAGERFDYNDRTKCKAQTGMDPEVMRQLLQHNKEILAKLPAEKQEVVKRQAAINRGEIVENEEKDNKSLQDKLDDHMINCNKCNILPKGEYCEEGQKILKGEQP